MRHTRQHRNCTEKEKSTMAGEEKPGVKSSTSILPCFLFVEVSQHPWTMDYFYTPDAVNVFTVSRKENMVSWAEMHVIGTVNWSCFLKTEDFGHGLMTYSRNIIVFINLAI